MEHFAELKRFYENEGREERRLAEGGIQRLEFLTASRVLAACLPPGARVLDSCAGSGVYAFHLAGQGHRVTAGDIVPYNVRQMREAMQAGAPALDAVEEMDARQLGRFAPGSFDAVLCMGALYHLPKAEDRRQAVQQALRVLRAGGLLVCSYMNRYAVVMNNLTPDFANVDEALAFVQKGREGIYYASHPGEMEALLAACGARVTHHVCLDGMATFLFHTTGVLRAEAFERYARYHLAVCEEASLLGSSYHNLVVCQKPGG